MTKIKKRKIQKGLVEVRFGKEFDEFKILTPKNADIFIKNLKKKKR